MVEGLRPDIPVYVKRNARAKRVWLKMRAGLGLEIVLPDHVSQTEIPHILKRHGEWITKQHAAQWARGEAPGQSILPDVISLAFLQQEYGVHITTGSCAQLSLEQTHVQMILPPKQEDLGTRLLQNFLKYCARKHLIPYCQEVAQEVGIIIGRVSIRNQSTRWGSCSAQHNISLNAKLLFLPRPLVRHVILHELCHVAHQNHGPQFWSALQALDVETQVHDQALRQAWDELPLWSRV